MSIILHKCCKNCHQYKPKSHFEFDPNGQNGELHPNCISCSRFIKYSNTCSYSLINPKSPIPFSSPTRSSKSSTPSRSSSSDSKSPLEVEIHKPLEKKQGEESNKDVSFELEININEKYKVCKSCRTDKPLDNFFKKTKWNNWNDEITEKNTNLKTCEKCRNKRKARKRRLVIKKIKEKQKQNNTCLNNHQQYMKTLTLKTYESAKNMLNTIYHTSLKYLG